MPATTAGYEGDVLSIGTGGVYDFVWGVEGDGGVCEGDGVEGGGYEVCWVVEEVFCCLGVFVSNHVRTNQYWNAAPKYGIVL